MAEPLDLDALEALVNEATADVKAVRHPNSQLHNEEWDVIVATANYPLGYGGYDAHVSSYRGPRAEADARFDATARSAAPALIAEVRRLRAGIGELRREHEDIRRWCDETEPCGGETGGWCDCGAAEHNAKVDALLGDTHG